MESGDTYVRIVSLRDQLPTQPLNTIVKCPVFDSIRYYFIVSVISYNLENNF